jgi:hypothetical protein
MFGFMKNGLFKRMNNYVTHIQVACAEKLFAQFQRDHDAQEARLLAAAVSNRLFGRTPSPLHSHLPSEMIDQLASEFLKTDDDDQLRYGIGMSLRTLMKIESDARNEERMKRIGDTVQWIKHSVPLPPEAPGPEIMEQLAVALHQKYMKE